MGLFGITDLINTGVQYQINQENQEASKEMQERNFYLNEKSAENAFRRQKEFYNAYQTPEAMRRQLEEAGYSAELYGGQMGTTGGISGQGAGNTGTASTSVAPHINSDPLADLKQLAEIENLKEETRDKKIENDAKEGTRTEERQVSLATQNQNLQKLIEETKNEGLKGELLGIQKEDASVTLLIKNATSGTEIELAGQRLKEAIERTKNIAQQTMNADYDLKYKKRFAGVMYQTAINQNLLLGQQIISEKYSRNMGEKMYKLAVKKFELDRDLGWNHAGNERLGLIQDWDKFTYTLEQTAEQFSEKMDQAEREMWWANVRAVLGMGKLMFIEDNGKNMMPTYKPSKGRY